MRLSIILIILILGNLSCKRIKTQNKISDINKIIISQNGKEIQLENGNQNLEIERNDFSIIFFNKKYDPEIEQFYAAQIAALPSKTDFQNIKVGMKQDEISCFSAGTGMAATEEGYEDLIIDDLGHHYLFYQNGESKRLKLISKENEYYKLEFLINSVSINGESFRLRDGIVKELFLSILIDRNSNRIIDEGELTNLTLKIR